MLEIKDTGCVQSKVCFFLLFHGTLETVFLVLILTFVHSFTKHVMKARYQVRVALLPGPGDKVMHEHSWRHCTYSQSRKFLI